MKDIHNQRKIYSIKVNHKEYLEKIKEVHRFSIINMVIVIEDQLYKELGGIFSVVGIGVMHYIIGIHFFKMVLTMVYSYKVEHG